MSPDLVVEAIAALSFCGAVFCAGGLAGLAMAWSQPARMRRWAALVERAQERVNEAELRGMDR